MNILLHPPICTNHIQLIFFINSSGLIENLTRITLAPLLSNHAEAHTYKVAFKHQRPQRDGDWKIIY